MSYEAVVAIGGIILIVALAVFGEKLFMKTNEALWGKEKPEKINGIKVRLGQFDWVGRDIPSQTTGIISGRIEGSAIDNGQLYGIMLP